MIKLFQNPATMAVDMVMLYLVWSMVSSVKGHGVMIFSIFQVTRLPVAHRHSNFVHIPQPPWNGFNQRTIITLGISQLSLQPVPSIAEQGAPASKRKIQFDKKT